MTFSLVLGYTGRLSPAWDTWDCVSIKSKINPPLIGELLIGELLMADGFWR